MKKTKKVLRNYVLIAMDKRYSDRDMRMRDRRDRRSKDSKNSWKNQEW
jgi:hypothetical protein